MIFVSDFIDSFVFRTKKIHKDTIFKIEVLYLLQGCLLTDSFRYEIQCHGQPISNRTKNNEVSEEKKQQNFVLCNNVTSLPPA